MKEGFITHCENCKKEINKGIIKKDNALRDRYFCSKKCIRETLDKQERKEETLDEEMRRTERNLIYFVTAIVIGLLLMIEITKYFN